MIKDQLQITYLDNELTFMQGLLCNKNLFMQIKI